MELVELKTSVRTTTGKGSMRALRRDNKLPGILYGPETDSILLFFNAKEIEIALKKSNFGQVPFNLTVENGDRTAHKAIIKEIQIHPISRQIQHVDFYKISLDQKIKMNIPVVPIGKSVGVELGGTLQIVRRELEVLCLPLEIPEKIEIDVTDLDIGDSIHVNEIPHDEEIELTAETDFTVLTVIAPRLEEEEEEIEEEEELEDIDEDAEKSEEESEE